MILFEFGHSAICCTRLPSSHDGLRLTGGPNAIRQITRTQYNTTKVNNGRVDQVSALNHKVMQDHVILQGKKRFFSST